MVKKILYLLVFSQAFAFAQTKNVYLQALMKSLSADLKVVQEPTKKPNAEVTDAVILLAIMRARSAQFFLQTAIDARGKIVEGKFVYEEMTPAGAGEDLDLVKAQQKLDRYAGYLTKARALFKSAELQLIEELNKAPEARDFLDVKTSLSQLLTTISEAHKIFRPPQF